MSMRMLKLQTNVNPHAQTYIAAKSPVISLYENLPLDAFVNENIF